MNQLFENGGPMMMPLLVTSLIGMTVILEKIYFWFCFGRLRDQNFETSLSDVKSMSDLEVKVNGSRDPLALMLSKGLTNDEAQFEERVFLAASQKKQLMNRGLGVLDTIVTLAPLLGILGTVLGIIDSFDLLGDRGLQDPQAVTGGIAQALISTAAGLTVAILSLIPLNIFRQLTRKQMSRVEHATGGLLLSFQIEAKNK